MSGGSLNYFYCELENHVGDFNDRELDDLVKDLAKLFYEREWCLSGDTNEGTWNAARDAFKKKWFERYSREKRVEQYLDEIRRELYMSFGVESVYCKDCRNWEPDKNEDEDFPYGWCKHVKGCMMHQCETCEKFERRVL